MSLVVLHVSNQVEERDLRVGFKFRLCRSGSDEVISRCHGLVCPSVAPRLVWYSSGGTLTKRTLVKDLLRSGLKLICRSNHKNKDVKKWTEERRGIHLFYHTANERPVAGATAGTIVM